MSWIYINSLDQLEVDLAPDTEVSGRWTFHRKMYFEPSQYEDWSQKKPISGTSYLSELISNQNIPSKGTPLTGALSGFYVKDIMSITSLTSDENIDQLSYAVVDILYENIQQPSEGGSYSIRNLKPWERPVEDFLVTNIETSVPAKYISDDEATSGQLLYPKTKADQPLYDLTMPKYKKRITWTIATRGIDLSFPSAFVNDNDVTFWANAGDVNGGKYTIKENEGLFLPPGLKKIFYQDTNGSLVPYDEWSYEVIVDEGGSHQLEYLNAGTQAFAELGIVSGDYRGVPSSKFDICAWYIATPPSGVEDWKFERKFGSFSQMMKDQVNVQNINYSISDEFHQLKFYGDFVQDRIPLDTFGRIDFNAALSGEPTEKIFQRIYNYVEVKLGDESPANIGFREKKK